MAATPEWMNEYQEQLARLDASLLASAQALQQFVENPVGYFESFGIPLTPEQIRNLENADLPNQPVAGIIAKIKMKGAASLG
jgi:hypothetical protein